MGRASTYSEKQRFTVFVLWLSGWRTSAIARALGLTKGQVSGIVTRSAFANRSELTLQERQTYLDELKAIRGSVEGGIDEGALKGEHFEARALVGKQR